MRNILTMLLATVRARMMPLWIRVRMWTSPTYLRSRFLLRIREFFARLLDVRPRHRRDYYPVFRWLVSKRLAFALVVGLGLASAIYIASMMPEGFPGHMGAGGIPSYRYRSIPLKFCSGTVQIVARDGHVAYIGEVEKGAASGMGALYSADGGLRYEGQFENSMYNGEGTLYYTGGRPQYTGSFTDNEFNGNGKYFRSSGALEYDGGYVFGRRTGRGTLYNGVGDVIFQGNFLNDEIVFHDFLNRPASEAAEMYTGETAVYQSEGEACTVMTEIGAAYAVKSGENALENEWTVNKVFVLRDWIPLASGSCTTVRQLIASLGQPLYFGESWVTLAEAAAWNRLAAENPDELESVRMLVEESLENVFTVSQYDRRVKMYLYTFEKDGLLYTFYFTGAGRAEFVMYALEKS